MLKQGHYLAKVVMEVATSFLPEVNVWEHLDPETERDFLCQEWVLKAMVLLWMDGHAGRCV